MPFDDTITNPEMRYGRHIVYVAFGPPLASICFCILVGLTASGSMSMPLASSFILFLFSLPFAYILGCVPAVFIGQVDQMMADRPVRLELRLMACGALAYLITLAMFNGLLLDIHHLPFELGLVGAVPAMICCFWTDRRPLLVKPRRRTAVH